MLTGLRSRVPWRGKVDQRAELLLGALASTVLLLIAVMIIFVVLKAWPSFAENGLSWFGAKGDVDQQLADSFNSSSEAPQYEVGAWPLIYATFLITGIAVVLAMGIALLSATFIVEFAPRGIQRILEPVVRLLAAVPSVVYGLIGILVLVPFVGQTLVTPERKASVEFVIQLDGTSILVGIVVLTVMITPIMIAIIVDALRAVPTNWVEGAAALGINRARALWTISIRAARPAIVAAAVLASARALGEAIMLSMVSGSIGFAPNPLDGLTFFFEPARPLAATIVEGAEGLSSKAFGETIYAFAAILLFSSAVLSFGGWYARSRLRKYTVQAR